MRTPAALRRRLCLVGPSRLLCLIGVVVTVTVTGCTAGSSPSAPASSAASSGSGPGSSTPAAAGSRPNVVFVLTDDLAMNLVQYMPHVLALEKAGTTFSNYTVTDSLCCPSRSSIFSGKFPHDTGVFTNTGADGGFNVFHSRGEESDPAATIRRLTRQANALGFSVRLEPIVAA